MSDTVVTDAAPSADLSLSLNDIQNALQVIDFAAEQGAFKGWKTIEQVLSVRNRLDAFLSAATAATEAAAGETDAAETTDAEA